jgi:hypothetical protein
MHSSTCFGLLHVHHQELMTVLTASDFTVGALLDVVWPVITGQTTTNNAATTRLKGKTRVC